MKILEAQSAVLTNFEVYTHLTELKERYAANRMFKFTLEGKRIPLPRQCPYYNIALLSCYNACMSDSYANTA